MNAQELMTRDPACVSASDTARRAAELLAQYDCGCLPVIDGEDTARVTGVVTDRDIAVRAVAEGKLPDTPVSQIMTTDVSTVRASDDISEVERVMSDRQIRRVVVVDDNGKCVGIISQADLALAVRRGNGIAAEDVAHVVEQISEPAGNGNPRRQPGGERARRS